jgi:hypothetical protein
MSELFTGGGFETAAATLGTPTSAPTPPPASTPAAADASSTAGSATTAPAASAEPSPATTTAVPGTPVSPTTPTPESKPPGPIPFDVHKTALENARTKAAQEAETKYGWAAAIPEQHRDTVGTFYRLMEGDPTQAVEVLIGTIANDPQHAPKLRSLLGRLLGTRPQGQPSATGGFPEPDTEGVDDQGNRIPLYSAASMPKIIAAIEQRLEAKYRPLEEDFRTRQQREQDAAVDAEMRRNAETWATQRYAQISAWPHYKANEAEIAKAMQADPALTEGDAYISVVVPKLSQQERQSVVASMHDKVAASSVNPATPTSGAPPRPKTFAEAFARLPAGSF